MRIPDEYEKYRKKKPSNVSKSSKKAKHRHKYEEVLFEYNSDIGTGIMHCLGKRCQVCGLLKVGQLFESDRLDNGCYRLLSDEEVVERHRDIPRVFLPGGIFSI